MPEAQQLAFSIRDGSSFPFLSWDGAPGGPIRADLVLLHGMGSAPSEIASLGDHLSRAGASCSAYALRAQGLDPRSERIGRQFTYDQLKEDFQAFCKTRPTSPGRPRYLMGESLGGLLALCLAGDPDVRSEIQGLILLCPVLELAQKTPGWLVKLTYLIAGLLPNLAFAPARFVHGKAGPPQLTADGEYQKSISQAPHKIPVTTLGFTASIGRLMELAQRSLPAIRQPVLILGGAHDPYITPSQLERQQNQLAASDKTLIILPKSYHLLLHDCESEVVREHIAHWIEGRSFSFGQR